MIPTKTQSLGFSPSKSWYVRSFTVKNPIANFSCQFTVEVKYFCHIHLFSIKYFLGLFNPRNLWVSWFCKRLITLEVSLWTGVRHKSLVINHELRFSGSILPIILLGSYSSVGIFAHLTSVQKASEGEKLKSMWTLLWTCSQSWTRMENQLNQKSLRSQVTS